MGRRYGDPRPEDQFKPGRNLPAEQPTKDEDPSPSAIIVQRFHKNAAVDTRPEDIHHTIGTGPAQAAAGDHNHDGGNSPLILEGITITGSKSIPATMWPSILLALTRLGAKDSTTA